LISAMTAGRCAAIFERSAPTKGRAAVLERAFASIDASGARSRAAAISPRFVSRIRSRMVLRRHP